MTAPDLDVLESLLAKATPGPWEFGGVLCLALRDLLPYVRELESLVERMARADSGVALAMRERCAQACEALKVNRPSDPLANAFDGACGTCAAAVRALEP